MSPPIYKLIKHINISNYDELLSSEKKIQQIASLLFKPDSFQYNYKVDYLGFSIPNDFIVGYGLDYDGYGRNLDSIYTIFNP